MAKERITEDTIAKFVYGGGWDVRWCDKQEGFGVRIYPSGEKAFIVAYRFKGRKKRAALGSTRDLKCAEARELARQWRADALKGVDRLQQRVDDRNAKTVNDLCDDYLRDHAAKKRTEAEDRRKIERHIRPKLGRLFVADVKRQDVADLHRKLKATPYEANRTLSLISKIFSFAVANELIPTSPVRSIERYHEDRREIFLKPDEIKRLSDALTAFLSASKRPKDAEKAVNVVRMLMLTGARAGEVLSATWEQFDIEAGVWVKPSSHTKQKREHRIPLSPPAVQLLQAMHKATKEAAKDRSPTGYLFPSRTRLGEPLGDIKSSWAEIRKLAKLPSLRLHDLRHTYASILASGGQSLPIIGRLLGHTQPQTTARYAHLYDDPLREATNRVGAVYGSSPETDAEVIDIRSAR